MPIRLSLLSLGLLLAAAVAADTAHDEWEELDQPLKTKAVEDVELLDEDDLELLESTLKCGGRKRRRKRVYTRASNTHKLQCQNKFMADCLSKRARSRKDTGGTCSAYDCDQLCNAKCMSGKCVCEDSFYNIGRTGKCVELTAEQLQSEISGGCQSCAHSETNKHTYLEIAKRVKADALEAAEKALASCLLPHKDTKGTCAWSKCDASREAKCVDGKCVCQDGCVTGLSSNRRLLGRSGDSNGMCGGPESCKADLCPNQHAAIAEKQKVLDDWNALDDQAKLATADAYKPMCIQQPSDISL